MKHINSFYTWERKHFHPFALTGDISDISVIYSVLYVDVIFMKGVDISNKENDLVWGQYFMLNIF